MGGDWYVPCAIYGYKLKYKHIATIKKYILDNYSKEYEDAFCIRNIRLQDCVDLYFDIKNLPIYAMTEGVNTRWEYEDIGEGYFDVYIGTLYDNTDVIECKFDDTFESKLPSILKDFDIDIEELQNPRLYLGCS